MRQFRVWTAGIAMLSFVMGAAGADQKTEDLFKARCQGCHGMDGKATMVGKKLGAKDFQDSYVTKMSKVQIGTIVSDGKNRMPAYKGKLTEEEIKALSKYIKELK